jgi:hypothetical protein
MSGCSSHVHAFYVFTRICEQKKRTGKKDKILMVKDPNKGKYKTS